MKYVLTFGAVIGGTIGGAHAAFQLSSRAYVPPYGLAPTACYLRNVTTSPVNATPAITAPAPQVYSVALSRNSFL